MKANIYDTIVAPATKITKQAITIIRLSGTKAFKITNSILKKALEYKNDQQLRKIYDNDKLIDEALVITFINDRSFTGEDTVEINCHGGVLLANKILSLLIENGARTAQPGEFSQRAFINGKINLLQAEGINNLIESKNELSIKINALNAIGKSNQGIMEIKEILIDVISKIQTAIDYPDYDDIEEASHKDIKTALFKLRLKINKIIENSQKATKINDGINTLILGNTNTGKSSLLNALISKEKAIVSDVPGTTRDVIEAEVNFNNFTLNLMDTAGIRKTINTVEKIGIEKSLKLIKTADLILFVIDEKNINKELFKKIKHKNYIVIVNKADLLTSKKKEKFLELFSNVVFTCAKNNQIDELITYIKQMWNNENLLLTEDVTILTNINNIAQLKVVLKNINYAIKNLDAGFSVDIINIDLYESLDNINNILGIIDGDEEIINNIFKKYCLGK